MPLLDPPPSPLDDVPLDPPDELDEPSGFDEFSLLEQAIARATEATAMGKKRMRFRLAARSGYAMCFRRRRVKSSTATAPMTVA